MIRQELWGSDAKSANGQKSKLDSTKKAGNRNFHDFAQTFPKQRYFYFFGKSLKSINPYFYNRLKSRPRHLSTSVFFEKNPKYRTNCHVR